jgi:DNA-binding IclR family transcriptional regulator
MAPAVTDLEEYSLGTVCVAVPVHSGDTLGSLGISMRVGRLSRADQVARLEQIRARLIPTAKRVTRGLSLTI